MRQISLVTCLIAFSLLFLRLGAQQVFAVSISISNTPSLLHSDEEFQITVTMSGAQADSSNYLRAAFYASSATTSYFGYTYNHLSNWYNGTTPIDPHQFLQIQIGSDGTWNGQIKAKIDLQSSYFKGNGEYYFKIGRYTASATSVSDWSDPVAITVADVQPTPTDIPTPSPTPTNTPTPTRVPTSLPTTKVPTPTKVPPTPTKSILASAATIATTGVTLLTSPTISKIATSSSQQAVLAASDAAVHKIKPDIPSDASKPFAFWLFFFIIGFMLLASCAILFFLR